MRTLITVVAAILLASCQTQSAANEFELDACWNNSVLDNGNQVSGKVVIFYNPDGLTVAYPLECEIFKLILNMEYFPEQNEVQTSLREMNTGAYLGGQFFEAVIAGEIQQKEGPAFGRNILIKRVEELKPIDKPVWLENTDNVLLSDTKSN